MYYVDYLSNSVLFTLCAYMYNCVCVCAAGSSCLRRRGRRRSVPRGFPLRGAWVTFPEGLCNQLLIAGHTARTLAIADVHNIIYSQYYK